MLFFISANRILQILCSVRKTDLKLVQVMERSELKMSYGSDFSKPEERSFLCPVCSREQKKRIVLVNKVCPQCGYRKM
jgi:predicted RNA-binding Zn-ribbon protein involved in translation (DUF1610 family)